MASAAKRAQRPWRNIDPRIGLRLLALILLFHLLIPQPRTRIIIDEPKRVDTTMPLSRRPYAADR